MLKPALTPWWRTLAFGFLALVFLSSLAPGLWTPNGHEMQFRDSPDEPPSLQFLLGTDSLGRDRLSRILHGTRVSLLLAPSAAALCCLIAALVGTSAALAGGWVDRTILAVTDLFLSLPWLFLLLAMRACLPLNTAPQTSAAITFLILGALGWPGPMRVIRAAVLTWRSSAFIFHAHAVGCDSWKLISRHMIPNVMPLLLAQFWISIPVFVLSEATLGMLGLGVAEPLPSWGGLLREVEGGEFAAKPWIATPIFLLAGVMTSLQAVLPREDYSV